MSNPIRLNKVLKELNISLDRAVEFLSSKKIEIEPRPTSKICLLYTSPSPRDRQKSRMPSSA